MSEKPAYRDNLERICQVYPKVEMLTVQDVIRFTGLHRQTVTRMFEFKDNYISKATLARELS